MLSVVATISGDLDVIRINSRDVPVASDGLFIDQSRPSSEGTIVLEAEKEDSKRTVMREFGLLH